MEKKALQGSPDTSLFCSSLVWEPKHLSEVLDIELSSLCTNTAETYLQNKALSCYNFSCSKMLVDRVAETAKSSSQTCWLAETALRKKTQVRGWSIKRVPFVLGNKTLVKSEFKGRGGKKAILDWDKHLRFHYHLLNMRRVAVTQLETEKPVGSWEKKIRVYLLCPL